MRFLDRLQPLALLVMRLALGAIMISYGAQSLDLDGFAEVMRGLGDPMRALATPQGTPRKYAARAASASGAHDIQSFSF